MALLVVVGCSAGDTTIDTTFDPCALAVDTRGMSDVQRGGVMAGLALWDLAPREGAPITVLFEDAAEAFHGHYDDETGVVRINAKITDPHALSIVIAHELGHAFGLFHVDGRASVMNRGNLDLAPTAADFAEVSARWGSCAAPLR